MQAAWRWEIWLLVVLMLLLMGVRVYPAMTPELAHDSFQYLSVAANALAGYAAHTSIPHFDAERSFGMMPAPLVTFPPGYAWTAAALARLGGTVQGAAFAVSLLATVATVLVLVWAGRLLAIPRPLRAVVAGLYAFNNVAIVYGTSIMSEALFTFVVTLAAALVVRARTSPGAGAWLGAGVAFGAAWAVRYAGLFFVVGLAVLVVRHLVASDRRIVRGYLIALLIAAAFVIVGIARNTLLAGHWKGGNELPASTPVAQVAYETIRCLFLALLGQGKLADNLAGRVVFLIALVPLVGLAVGFWLRRMRFTPARFATVQLDLALLVLVYVACMMYAGATTVIAYNVRMFVPLVPMLLLLAGALLAASFRSIPRRTHAAQAAVAALAAALVGYGLANLYHLRTGSTSGLGSRSMEIGDDEALDALRRAVRAIAGADGVIVANNGQLVGHVLEQPTVSLVGPHYSATRWDEAAVRDTVTRFGARAIVVYVPAGREWQNEDTIPSAFVRMLAEGRAPEWLQPLERTGRAIVYAVR